MKQNRLLYLAAFMICSIWIISCGSPKKEALYTPPIFEQVTTARTSLLSEPIIASVFFGIETYQDRLIVLAYMDDCFVHWYDKTTGAKLGSALRQGKAPNEILFIDNYLFDANTGRLSIFDQATKRIAVFDLIDTTAKYCATETVDALPAWSNAAFKIAPSDQLLFCAEEASRRAEIPAHRISLISAGQEVSWCDEDPIQNAALSSFVHQQPRITFSPDRSRCAIGTFFGAILELYSIDHNKLKQQSTAYLLEPKPMELFQEMSFGFADMAATNDRIYTAYNGTQNIQAFSAVAIFDWEGRPIEIIEPDQTLNIARLCVASKQRVYTVADTGDRTYRIVLIEPNR